MSSEPRKPASPHEASKGPIGCRSPATHDSRAGKCRLVAGRSRRVSRGARTLRLAPASVSGVDSQLSGCLLRASSGGFLLRSATSKSRERLIRRSQLPPGQTAGCGSLARSNSRAATPKLSSRHSPGMSWGFLPQTPGDSVPQEKRPRVKLPSPAFGLRPSFRAGGTLRAATASPSPHPASMRGRACQLGRSPF